MNSLFHLYKSIFLALAMALLLGACATVNWDYPRVPSKAFTQPETTAVGALFGEAADKHPGLSGFSLVEYGENAFLPCEVAYDREFKLSPLAEALDKANEYGITLMSMKQDWRAVFD